MNFWESLLAVPQGLLTFFTSPLFAVIGMILVVIFCIGWSVTEFDVRYPSALMRWLSLFAIAGSIWLLMTIFIFVVSNCIQPNAWTPTC